MKVYGDISGYLKTFLRLRARLPEGRDLALADLIDRGPQSKQVIEWFMAHGESILGNHEHMFLDFYGQVTEGSSYEYPLYAAGLNGAYLRNGGVATLQSYGIDQAEFLSRQALLEKIPTSHIDYLKGLSWYKEENGFIFTHAPIFPKAKLEDVSKFGNFRELEASLLWNRFKPRKIDNVIQIYGHNSAEDCLVFTQAHREGIYLAKFLATYGSLAENKSEIFAICLDTANRGDKLSCLHVPTFTIHQEEILPEDKA